MTIEDLNGHTWGVLPTESKFTLRTVLYRIMNSSTTRNYCSVSFIWMVTFPICSTDSNVTITLQDWRIKIFYSAYLKPYNGCIHAVRRFSLFSQGVVMFTWAKHHTAHRRNINTVISYHWFEMCPRTHLLKRRHGSLERLVSKRCIITRQVTELKHTRCMSLPSSYKSLPGSSEFSLSIFFSCYRRSKISPN